MLPRHHTLKNGLRVVLVDTKAFPTLTTLLLVGAGSRYENEKNNGIAHFFEHMAFKGSRKYPSSYVISSVVEGLGGVFNAFTSKDHTGYWIKATNEHFTRIIDVLSDMVLHPLLMDEEIDREKGVIIEEINMYQDTPIQKIGEIFETILYKDNPLGYEIAGFKKTVSTFTRKMFLEYIKKLYHPKNAVLVIAGGLGDKDYLSVIEDKFSRWREGNQTDFIKVVENQDKPRVYFKYKKTEQTHFCLGFRAFSFFDKRRIALDLLSTILGKGMSSRLFIQVRERRGLCYYISTGRELYADVGNFVTQAGVSNDPDKIKEAIETTLAEHKKISVNGITDEELQKAKEFTKGRLLLSLEDSINVASFFGKKKLLRDTSETLQETIGDIEKTSKEEIVSLAKDIFRPESMNLAMIGPFEHIDLNLNI